VLVRWKEVVLEGGDEAGRCQDVVTTACVEVIGGVSEGAGVGAINRVSEAACEIRWLKWLLMPHRLWWLDTSELSES
jgi:hypothetical protein